MDWSYWLVLATMLILLGEAIHSRVSEGGRASWERDTRRKVRIEHALRHHVSIGAADRALVTERAQAIRTMSMVALVGWPMLAVVAAAPILDLSKIPDLLVVPVMVARLLLLARSGAGRTLGTPLAGRPAAPRRRGRRGLTCALSGCGGATP